jgi:hypothetical protein
MEAIYMILLLLFSCTDAPQCKPGFEFSRDSPHTRGHEDLVPMLPAPLRVKNHASTERMPCRWDKTGTKGKSLSNSIVLWVGGLRGYHCWCCFIRPNEPALLPSGANLSRSYRAGTIL